jgi:hypothetical protein
MTDDPDYKRGFRGPGPVPGRGAWNSIKELRRLTLALDKFLRITLMDVPEREVVLGAVDQASCYAEVVILRYDRNGPPETQSELADMEATIRLAAKYPDQFKGTDIEAMKKLVAGQKRKCAS